MSMSPLGFGTTSRRGELLAALRASPPKESCCEGRGAARRSKLAGSLYVFDLHVARQYWQCCAQRGCVYRDGRAAALRGSFRRIPPFLMRCMSDQISIFVMQLPERTSFSSHLVLRALQCLPDLRRARSSILLDRSWSTNEVQH